MLWITSNEAGIGSLILGILFLYFGFAVWMQKATFEKRKQPAIAVLMSAPQIQASEAILSVWLPILHKPNNPNKDIYQCYIPAAYVQYLPQQFPVFYTKSRLMFGIPTVRIEAQGIPLPEKNTRNRAQIFCFVTGVLLLIFGFIIIIAK